MRYGLLYTLSRCVFIPFYASSIYWRLENGYMMRGQSENAPGPVQAGGRDSDSRQARAAPPRFTIAAQRFGDGDLARSEIANALQNDPSFTTPAA